MSNKFVVFIIFFTLQILLINSSSEDPVYYPNIWNPVSLYDYVSKTYLNPSNPSLYSNIQHMIVDPERYLQYADLREARQFMHLLYENYNISSHVFFISHMESKYKLDEEIASFVSQLSYLLYKNYEIYDEKMTLTAVFFIKDRKMRIRTSKDLRQILTDYDCLNILNRRKNDLINYNYQQVVNGLMRDIFDFYEYNLENKGRGSNHFLLYTIMLIVIVMIIYVLYNNYKEKTSSKQEDKVKVFLDKLKNRKNPKEVFTESCIICLGDFLSNEKIKEIENSGDKENFEKEETSVLECGHKFHRKCIAEWLNKEPNCPMCRMKFNIKGNDNNSNKQNAGFNFESILSEILRIQSNRNLLNNREINRIRNVYYPNRNNRSTSIFPNFSSYFPNNNFFSSRYSSSSSHNKSYSSHNKSYSSYNKRSGGATSGW